MSRILGLDVSTKTIGIALFEDNGEGGKLQLLTHITPKVKPKPTNNIETLIKTVKAQAAGILQNTDWYIVRKADAGTAVPSAITTYRAAVRTKCAAMETLITNASNTPAIETLYIHVNTADEGDPVVMERPLGVFPVLGS